MGGSSGGMVWALYAFTWLPTTFSLKAKYKNHIKNNKVEVKNKISLHGSANIYPT